MEAGQPHLGELAGVHLLNAAAATTPAPSAVTALAYPAPWPDLVQRFADEHRVDPLLMYAMMRQESAFNPTAGSSAGAFGLTQVIAPTAQEIARALGRTEFAFRDLARPVVAIQFGALYLGTQLKNFNGNVYQALAAYNGGPGNAARWARPAGPADVDRFYEEVDYSETKLYLRLVLQNYARYRSLYGGASQPSLVGDGR
jgi:soluble lytic murein transglycosylase